MSKDTLEQNVEALLDGSGTAPRMDTEARDRLRAKLIARHAVKRSPLWAVGFGVAAAAAAALLLVRGGGDEPAQPQANAMADGSTWVTEPGAKVTVLGPRHVRVEGAALLDVAPGKGTFVVDTARGHIEVLGTKFLVDADASHTTAAVVRGSVKLASSDGDVTLHAGEQGVAMPGHPPTRGPAPRLSHLASWAAEQRHRDEHAPVVHHGTLFAKDPGIRSHPPWGDEYPLPMARLGVDVVVEDRIARVALDQTFHNELAQTLEGTYRFAIPADAALQRLAMYVDGKLMESGVVERMQARRIYEELVYRRVDPALLEWAGTGRLNLRVYPIPANEDKRLMLAYTQSLPKLYEDWTLTVPFPEVDRPVGALDFSVRLKACATCQVSSPSHQLATKVDGADLVVSYHATDAALGDSLVLRVRDTRTQPTVARDGEFLMVRAPAELRGQAEPYHERAWVILDDVSASRDRGERRAQADLVDAFLHELDEDDRVGVVAFDVAARTVLPMTRVNDADRRAVAKALSKEGDVGATDLGVGLDAALALLAAEPDANIVYLGDGVITAGPQHLDELRAKLVGHARFIGVGVGDGPDVQTLDALAGATGGYATSIDLADDLGWRAFDLVAALHTQRVTDVSAKLEGADGATIYLRAPQVADGEEVELVANGAAKATRAVFTGTLGGQPWTRSVELTDAHAGGYLPRLWAQRHIAARLLAKHDAIDPDQREARDEAIRREVVELGKKYFLLSRHTSLIVLENDAMYAQYGVQKGSGQMWAPYAMPERIDAKHPVVRLADTDQPLERAPLELFSTYDPYSYRNTVADAVSTRASLGFAETKQPADKPTELAKDADREPAVPAATAQPAGETTLAEGHMGKGERQQLVATGGVLAVTADTRGFGGLRGNGSGVGYGFGGGRRGRGWAYAAQTYPQRLTYVGDPAFDDLTAWMPALATDDAIAWEHALGAPATHVVEPAARDLLAAARAAVPAGLYRWGALELAIDGAHRVGWKRTTDAGLGEVAAYDGATLVRRYPELGLDVVGSLDGAIAQLAYLPILVADPASVARYFDAKVDAGKVVLARGGRAVGALEFDAAHHLTAIVDGSGTALVRVTWTGNAPTAADVRGERIAVGFTADPIADAPAWAQQGTVAGDAVRLPLRQPAHWIAAMAGMNASDAAYRDAARQLMASYRAGGNPAAAAQLLRRDPTRGELALGGALAAQPASPLVTDLRTLRALLEQSQRGDARSAAEQVLKLQSAQLRLVATSLLTSAYAAPAELLVKAWDALAVGRMRNTARAQAAMLLMNRGDNEGAAARVIALATDYDVAAEPVNLQWATYMVTQSRRGPAGWALAYGAMRDRVMASNDVDQLMALVPLAQQQQQAPAVLLRAGELAAGDPDRLATVAQLAATYGQAGLAVQLIAPVLAAHPTRALAQLAAGLDLQAGRLADGLAHLEQAQALGADEPIGLATMRGELAQLVGVAQQLALSSTGPARDAAVVRATSWGAKWRAVDPGNPATDEALGRLYLALGNTQEAWRQLSGVIERDPWNGQGYATVAQTYEQQGKVADALPFWQQAIIIDQTNPTHRLRKAQALIALGRTAEGEAILHDITGRKWHDAWSGVVYQAQELLARGKH